MLAAMHETARLAGFFAAHGIWNVSDGATLIPMIGYESANGDRGLDRFAAGDLAVGAQAGQDALRANPRDAVRAVLVVDGYVHLQTGRTDALIIDAVSYGPSALSFKVAVPYRPKASAQGFAVHRPKFLEMVGVDRDHYQALSEAFFAGVDDHEPAAAVWNAHEDPSI